MFTRARAGPLRTGFAITSWSRIPPRLFMPTSRNIPCRARKSAAPAGDSSPPASWKSNPPAPYERAMMPLVNTHSEGLTILPAHRVAAHLHDFSWSGVRRHLEPWFAAEALPFSSEENKAEARREFLGKLVSARKKRAIGVYPAADPQKTAFYVLTLRDGVSLA